MSKYRIIKIKGYDNLYIAQKRVYWVFWVTINRIDFSLRWCEYAINKDINESRVRMENPKDVIIKEYL